MLTKHDILQSVDSYKTCHWLGYPEDTEVIHSYLEARVGATYPKTVFFGLQSILKEYMVGKVVWPDYIYRMKQLTKAHLGDEALFNEQGWRYILDRHEGHLPLLIKAVPEGTPVDVDNVLMTVENTGGKQTKWLTNYVESLLTHVWHPSTVATLSYFVKQSIKSYLNKTSDNPSTINFMLHDFGYRGVSSHESAALGGAGHLVNFLGTDTIPALQKLVDHYGATYNNAGFSVIATEHSIMTSLGVDGEHSIALRYIKEFPNSIVSLVIDSYDPYNFVKFVCDHKEDVLARTAKLVLRPDSNTGLHPTPPSQVLWIIERLAHTFGYTVNSKGYKVLNPAVGVIWGDGIGPDGINNILAHVANAGWSVECLVFGMGGGLLQKVNRDTQRFAFKCSAQLRNGVWMPIQKNPLDQSKKSKAGRLKLIKLKSGYNTINIDKEEGIKLPDELVSVFHNGKMLKEYTIDEVRANANQ
jgi:nicotinamide phosphoribosyltransferase